MSEVPHSVPKATETKRGVLDILRKLFWIRRRIWTKVAYNDMALENDAFIVSVESDSNIDGFRKAVLKERPFFFFSALDSADLVVYPNKREFDLNRPFLKQSEKIAGYGTKESDHVIVKDNKRLIWIHFVMDGAVITEKPLRMAVRENLNVWDFLEGFYANFRNFCIGLDQSHDLILYADKNTFIAGKPYIAGSLERIGIYSSDPVFVSDNMVIIHIKFHHINGNTSPVFEIRTRKNTSVRNFCRLVFEEHKKDFEGCCINHLDVFADKSSFDVGLKLNSKEFIDGKGNNAESAVWILCTALRQSFY